MRIFEHYTDMEAVTLGHTTYLCNNYGTVYLKKTRPYKINFREELHDEIIHRKRNKVSLSPDFFHYWLYTRKVWDMKVFEHFANIEVGKVGYTPYLCVDDYTVYLRNTKPYKINFRKELVTTVRHRRWDKNSLPSDTFYYWLYTRKM